MKLCQASLLVFSIFLLSFAFIGFTYAASSKTGLSTSQLEEFAQNNILFYDPSQCIGGTSSGICGSNTKEKLWTALRQHFDEVHTAAALGNILHEGGLNPLRWEYKAVNNGNPPTFDSMIDDWNKFYDGTYMNICYDSDFESWYCIGVGDFAITSRLDKYLQYIKENEPDLFDYFKDPKYTYMEGDSLIDELGEDIYDRLIELEVTYFVEEWIDQGIKETFESYTDVTGAARYYSDKIMACGACHSDSVMSARAASAEEMYEELKGFSCTPKSSSSSSSGSSSSSNSTSDITLIGDSIAVMAEEELQEKFPDAFFTMVGSRHSTSGGACPSDKGGLEILQKLSDGSGTILTQHHNKNSCDEVIIDKNSLKDNVVWELGTNSIGASKETIEKVIKLVGDDRKLFLVTPYNGDSRAKDDTEAIAQMYRDVAEEYDNVYVVDWADAVKDSGYTYVYAEPSMTVHPTDEGKELLAKLISEAVSGSDGCTTYDGEYPQYIQWDEPWGNLPYSNGTYGDSACGAASMAMLATVATGQDIFPNDIGDFLEEQSKLGNIPGGASPYYDSTSVTVLDPIVGDHYGFEVINETYSDATDAEEKIRKYLKDGYMIHLTGVGTDFFGPDGHVIGIFNIDNNDNVMLANSAWTLNGEASLKDVASHLLWGVFTAIKGNGSKNDCNNLCNNNSNDSFASLNEEQAQKIADYYNSNEVTAENFIGGHIPSDCSKMNCVSFSLWFVSAFTDAAEISPTPSLVGDGSYIADTGLPSIGWETGNDPTPYSVFGGAGRSAWSHTGVVVGTTDDGNILTIEAAYINHGSGCVGWDAQVTTRDPSYFSEGFGILAYPGSHLTPNEGHLGNKSLNEIIGS